MGKKKGAAVPSRCPYGIYLAIALLIAVNAAMAVWLYQGQDNRVAVPELLVAGWDGLLSLLNDVYELAGSTVKKISS